MGKFPFIVEQKVFAKRASFLQIPIKMGKFPKKWENSLKNGKVLIIVEHVVFEKRASFL
jgi:hypothetical protein